MLGKLKDTLKAKEVVDEISEKLNQQSGSLEEQKKNISELSESVSLLKSEIEELNSNQRVFLAEFRQSMEAVNELKKELNDDLVSLRVLKGQLQSKVADKIDEEFSIIKEKIEKEVAEISKLKDGLSLTNSGIAGLKLEVDKLKTISSQIKQNDFEMVNYAKKIEDGDKEKLKLMREIDSLQRLVSKIRRNQSYPGSVR